MPSRRNFLKTAGLGIIVAGIPPVLDLGGAHREDKSTLFPVGIAGFTFAKFNIAQSIAMMTRVNVHAISLKDFHLPLNSTPEKIAEVLGQFKSAGITVYGVGVIYMKTKEQVDNAFEYARKVGVDLIIGVPDYDLLDYAEQKTKEYNIRLAIHNHGPEDKLYPGPGEVYDRIRSRDHRMGLCMDIGHAMRAGVKPSEAALKYGDRLLDLHIKDVNGIGKGDHAIETGRGIIDFPEFVKSLQKIKYKGHCSIEYEKDMGDPLPGIAESVGYFRGVMAAISERV